MEGVRRKTLTTSVKGKIHAAIAATRKHLSIFSAPLCVQLLARKLLFDT